MKTYLNQLKESLENEIFLANKERLSDGLAELKQIHLKILGQSALLFNPAISKIITIIQTRDLDAIIEGDWSLRSLIKRAIARIDLEYDDLSKEIWVPPGSSYVTLFESKAIKLEALDPFFVFLSKAVKAPEKNKELIVQALALYGERLASAIVSAGGSLEVFLDE